MILSTDNPRAILSHYPKRYEDYESDPDPLSTITVIKRAFVNKNGIVTFHGAEHVSPPPHTPNRAHFIAAGFLFVSGDFLKEVPFDPDLDHLFAGEEILLTIRAYTNGWDVYTPNLDILYHKYTRKNEPKFWDYYTYKAPTEAEKKVRSLTHPAAMAVASHRYGLGGARTVREFYQSAPIDVPRRLWWWWYVVLLVVVAIAVVLYYQSMSMT
jgi:UDP-GlcNAc:polypeptide alpha-N-acetylglucosaminyltransferase